MEFVDLFFVDTVTDSNAVTVSGVDFLILRFFLDAVTVSGLAPKI